MVASLPKQGITVLCPEAYRKKWALQRLALPLKVPDPVLLQPALGPNARPPNPVNSPGAIDRKS